MFDASIITKKVRLGLCLASLLFSGMSAISANAQTAVPNQLKVGLEVAYPPFESYEGDKIVGFDPELTMMLARAMKLQPTFVDTKFASLILGLGAGQHDAVISGLYITTERLAVADAIPYAKSGALILASKDGVMPKSENDLCGLKVGLQAGTSWVKKLKDLSTDYCAPKGKPAVDVHEFPTAPEVLQALLSKNIQAQIEVAAVAKAFAEKSRGRVVISSPSQIYMQTLGVFVKKGNVALKQAFEAGMVAIKKSGEYDALIKKYDLGAVDIK
ncbi:transporter substrate-binding domain-containing protein [Herbaspirillum sp. CAH-3]|uniref:transporter substrate-binding domain-containing protein n=1 Tax=Herbaspirillum sp. CAH-3 TaxID=2605746 RepID=UPI0012AC8E6B|nr:transporter substrate-binding domain-containing protein [Herbaspirillum sp. CAH-3]MRT28679.1 transporter substrate-binding domain-containing protein [Herbaspirillum sp. CAH-3]